MLGPFHWLHEISLPRRVWHYFWRGQKARAKNTRPICLLVQSMGGGKSSCWKFYNPQLQTMFNVLCCPASPYYYKRILQSVLSTGLLYKRILQSVFGPFHLELCFCPWQRSCEPLWSISIYRHLGLATNEKERSKVSGDDTKAREGRKNTGSCCGSTILLLLLVWLLLLLVHLAPFL
jgi:hypothetical protein